MFKLLSVLITGALPILEIRGAIPLGVGVYGLPLPLVFTLGFVGNIIPVLILLWGLDPFLRLIRRWSHLWWLDQFITATLNFSHRQHSRHFEKWGNLALFVFVALPLPGTGGWTGAILAYLFGFSFGFALLSIALGIIVAGAVISVITLGGVGIAGLL